jgi:DNA repair protein RadC
MTTPSNEVTSTGSDVEEIAYVPSSSPPPPSPLVRLACAGDVYAALANIRRKDREHLVTFHLNVRHRVLRRRTVHIGTLTGVECHPREILKAAIVGSAAAIIVAHNHPSGDPTPSRADIELTVRLREVGELCGIPLLDHVIVCATGYVSMAERNWH